MNSHAAKVGELALQQQGRFARLRPLAWDGTRLYASRGYALLMAEAGPGPVSWQRIASFRPPLWRVATSKLRLTYRLCRDGFHALVPLPNGTLVGVVPGAIVTVASGASEFSCTFDIRRGTRPLALAATSQGDVFWGEYFDNRERLEVYVYGSHDSGRTWDVAHVFSRGSIRHVHNIVYDRWRDCLWVATGDYDEECRILRVSPDWREVEDVVHGNQQTRAVALIPSEEGVYFASDTPLEENYTYLLDTRGDVKRLGKLNGSCFFGCRVGEAVFFSTAVEPSSVNTEGTAAVYGSMDGENFQKLIEWRKDRWHMGLFQYGAAVLPAGENQSGLLATGGIALEENDLDLTLWSVRSSTAGTA